MKIMTPETKVGLLTIAVGIALLYISVKAGGLNLFGDGKSRHFYMHFASVAGVEIQSKVKLSGVEIGYVDDVVLEEGYASIKAVLVREALIRKNAIATIRTAGLLGESYIEIVQGSSDQPPLQDGEILANTRSAADISDMMSKIGEALDDVKAVTSSMRKVFGSLEGEKALRNILGNIDKASANLQLILADNRGALKDTLKNFAIISEEFANSAPQLSKNLEKVAAGLEEIISTNKDNLTAGIENIKELTAQFREILKENRKNIKTTLDNVALASQKVDGVLASVDNVGKSLKNITGKIERGEGTMGKLVTDESVYKNLNKTLVGVGKFLNNAEELRLDVGFRGEWQSDFLDSKAFLTLRLRPREDKYYLLEITEDIREDQEEDEKSNTLGTILYTAQIAKRFSNMTIRGGLMESSVGAGLDYHMFGDRITATAEVFNIKGYDENADNPQVKAWIKWNPQKYIYVYLGGDELLNEHYRTFLLGGGILFDDDDLKMAAGLLY